MGRRLAVESTEEVGRKEGWGECGHEVCICIQDKGSAVPWAVETGTKHTINCSSILPRRSSPGCSSRWWLADVSAMVDTMAIQ